MTAPYLHVGLWDDRRDSGALLEEIRVHLLVEGADVPAESSDTSLTVTGGTPLVGPDRTVTIESMAATRGGLVQLVIGVGDLSVRPVEDWRELMTAVSGVVTGVRPVLATVAVEEPPDALPDPSWAAASPLLGTGWVDVKRCTTVQRLRFADLVDLGIAAPHGDGLAWSDDAALSLTGRVSPAAPLAVAAAVFEAWTGIAAAAPDPATDVADPSLPIPQVWWWSQGEDPEAVRLRVEAATGTAGSPGSNGAATPKPYVDPSGDPGWQPVIADLPPGAAGDGLELLRSTVEQVRPSWAALQPAGGLAVPGMDPEIPATGVLVNPWVSREWMAEDLVTLERIFEGAYREEFAGGVLWVTDCRVAQLPDAAAWSDDDARWERLVAAADVLGGTARKHDRD